MIHPAIARALPRLPREPVACLIDLSTLVEMAAEWTEFRTRTGHRGAYNQKTQKKVYGDEAERVLGAERSKPKESTPKQRPNRHAPADWSQIANGHLATLHALKQDEAKRKETREKFVKAAVAAVKASGETLEAVGKKTVGSKLWGLLSTPVKWAAAKLGAAAKFIDHLAEKAKEGSQRLAMQVAKERGYDERHVERVGEIVQLVDGGNAWGGPNIAAVHDAIEHVAHVATGWTAFALAKIGFYLPTASLLYSVGAALDPRVGLFVVGIAAWKVVTGRDVGRHGPEGVRKAREAKRRAKLAGLAPKDGPLDVTEMATGSTPGPLSGKALARALFDRLDRAGDGADWWLALFCAAWDHTHDARQAFRLADRGFKRHPRGEQLAAQVQPEDIAAMLDYTPPEARR